MATKRTESRTYTVHKGLFANKPTRVTVTRTSRGG